MEIINFGLFGIFYVRIGIMPRRTVGASCGVRHLGGKPAKTGGDVDAAAKERPEEAPFAALRQHGFRTRTCSRKPTAKPAHPKNKYNLI